VRQPPMRRARPICCVEPPRTSRRACRSSIPASCTTMRAMGLADFTLPHSLHPLTVARTMAGPVFTVRGKVTPNADPHETLLAWTGFLSKAKSGHVVVIAANDDEVAHMGELSGETLVRKGVPGVVADGGVRDVEFLIEMGFPVYARYTTPRDIVGYWMVDAM